MVWPTLASRTAQEQNRYWCGRASGAPFLRSLAVGDERMYMTVGDLPWLESVLSVFFIG